MMSYIPIIAVLKTKYMDAYHKKDYMSALFLSDEIIKTYQENDATKTISYGEDCMMLAELYADINNHPKCIALYQEALQTIRALQGESALLAEALNNMAIHHSHLGEYDTALTIMLKAYYMKRTIFSPTSAAYRNSLYNVGVCYHDVQEYDKALHYHMSAMKDRPTNDEDAIDNLNFIGYDFEGKGDIKNALFYFEKALALIRTQYGDTSDEYFKNLYYLASIHENDGNYEVAKQCYKEAIHLLGTILTTNHPYYAEALNKLAAVYTKLNQTQKALQLRLDALKIIEKTVGEDNMYYANCLKHIGNMYSSRGAWPAACEMYEKSIGVKKTLLGEDSEEYVGDLLILSNLYNKCQQFEKALSLLSEVVGKINTDNRFYTHCIYTLAKIYMLLGDIPKVYELYEKMAQLKEDFSFSDMLDNLEDA